MRKCLLVGFQTKLLQWSGQCRPNVIIICSSEQLVHKSAIRRGLVWLIESLTKTQRRKSKTDIKREIRKYHYVGICVCVSVCVKVQYNSEAVLPVQVLYSRYLYRYNTQPVFSSCKSVFVF